MIKVVLRKQEPSAASGKAHLKEICNLLCEGKGRWRTPEPHGGPAGRLPAQ